MDDALHGGTGVLEAPPDFGALGFVVTDGTYHRVSVEHAGHDLRTATTLQATPTEERASDAADLSSLPAADRDRLDDAVAKARTERLRQYSESTADDEAPGRSDGQNRPDDPGQSDRGNRPDVPPGHEVRQRARVLSPHESVPAALSGAGEGTVVADGGEPFEVEVVEQTAAVSRFELTATEVASGADAFDDWFLQEHVLVDTTVDALSSHVQTTLEQATDGGYEDRSPYDETLREALRTLEMPADRHVQGEQIARIDGELVVIELSQGVGC